MSRGTFHDTVLEAVAGVATLPHSLPCISMHDDSAPSASPGRLRGRVDVPRRAHTGGPG